MATETYTLDATSVDATNVAVELEDPTNGVQVLSISFPEPDENSIFAGSADTEGDPLVQNRFGNRSIPVQVKCFSAPGAASTRMRQRVRDLQRKAGKIKREGGTLKRVLGDSTVIIFDLLNCTVSVTDDFFFQQKNYAVVTLNFTAKPLGRGVEVTLTDHAETTLPCVIGLDTGVTGDWPGLGRLIVDDDEAAQDQFWMMYGSESKGIAAGTSATNALFYQAPTRLLYGPSVLRALSGASGGTVAQGTATTSYQAVMSTSSSGTAYCTNIGDFNVWARVYDHGGTVGATAGTASLTWALEWTYGDFQRVTHNDGTVAPVAVAFSHLNLGQVHIPQVTQGAQRWEGRILVKGTDAAHAYSVDDIYLQPISEYSGQASGVFQAVAPTAFTARDEFSGTAGNLNTATAPTGGAWATSGATTDFAVEATGHTAQRATTSDSAPPARFAISGATAQTNQVVQVDFKTSAYAAVSQGVIARYVDSNNYAQVIVAPSNGIMTASLVIGGFTTVTFTAGTYPGGALILGTTYTMRVQVDTLGRLSAWLFLAGTTPGAPLVTGQNALLATAGTLASGKGGFLDGNSSATAATRNYDNFWIATPIPDAAIYATRSLEIRADQVIRQDSAGSVWTPPSKYVGDYFLVPPAGAEARSVRTIVKACRNDPATGADAGIDDISFQIKVQPRWLSVPEP